jgi:hypothetical protein
VRELPRLLQLSISITNSKLAVVDVYKAIRPVIESMSVPSNLIIETFSGCKENMNKEDVWQAHPNDTQQKLNIVNIYFWI